MRLLLILFLFSILVFCCWPVGFILLLMIPFLLLGVALKLFGLTIAVIFGLIKGIFLLPFKILGIV